MKFITVHCSATKEGVQIDADTIRRWHKQRGWSDIGYHYIIGLDGQIEIGRPLNKTGAHVAGHNTDNIGICYVGGLDAAGNPKDTRTDLQIESLHDLIEALCVVFDIEEIKGHRDWSPDTDGDGEVEQHEWLKACPSFDAISEYGCYVD